MLRKDKEKVLDEVWTEDHVRSFLEVRPFDDTNEDFFILLKAYQSMRADDFELFVGFFLAENRSLDARDKHDRTVLDIISTHRHGTPFAEVLKQAGAAH